MALTYQTADRASNVLAALQAVDPASLQTDRDRALRTAAIAILETCPATYGVKVQAVNDDSSQCWLQVLHEPFGTYAI